MNKRTIYRLTLAAIAAVIFTASAFAQSRTNQIYRPCPGSTTPASVKVAVDGAITITPCSGKTVTINGTSASGFVVGPASATDTAIAVYDLTTGKLIKNSVVTISAAGTVTVPDAQSLKSGIYALATATGGTVDYGDGANATTVKVGACCVGQVQLQVNGTTVAMVRGDTRTFSAFSGAAVASAAAIVPTGNLFHITGVAAITSITSTNITAGTCITMIFDSTATLTDGSNLKLAGNFVATADDTLSACYDGTNWYETTRAVN